MVPTSFSSIQVFLGHLYLFGGLSQDGQVSKSCWEIDPNLNMAEKAPMKMGRFNMALGLLFDKFIFVMGGSTSSSNKTAATDMVEAYDISTNTWYPVGSLNRARSCTTACI